MKYLIRLPLLVLMFLYGQTLFAGPASHGHSHDHGPITSEQAIMKSTKHVRKLVHNGKIDASWLGANYQSVEQKSFGHGPEWVVAFENKAITDPTKKILYVFFTLNGEYLASNFTGQ